MNPKFSKQLLNVFNQATEGKRHTTKVGDEWIYTEDVERGLREVLRYAIEHQPEMWASPAPVDDRHMNLAIVRTSRRVQ